MSLDLRSSWESASREVALSCDANGVITAADAPASRLLQAAPGVALRSLAVPGTEAKVDVLVARASSGIVANWELSLVSLKEAATVIFQGRPAAGGGIELYGLVLPDGYTDTVRHLNESMGEVVTLNRELSRQRKELEESNRGVLALHAEIADKADTLRRNLEVKSRVVAQASHELRTPLNAILGLTRLLLEGTDGPLNEEQYRQVSFVHGSAEELSRLVRDVLELAMAESGRLQLRPEVFTLEQFFSAVRGTVRPLIPPGGLVKVVIEPPAQPITLNTDQGKLAQIVRNLLSNALKFTERGEIRVSARDEGEQIAIEVRDTGIGIAPADFGRIFEEFGQVENPLQRRVEGSGLGLPLSRTLADVLGGTLTVDSAVGTGSTFTVVVPKVHPEVTAVETLQARPLEPGKAPVLVVDDDRHTIVMYEEHLARSGFQVLPARTIAEARALLARRPAAVVLDVMLETETTWDFLSELKQNPDTRQLPVVVVTVLSRAEKARALGADEFWLKPLDEDRLVKKLRSLIQTADEPRLLVVRDDNS